MTLSAPEKIKTTTKTFRVSDETARMIDERSNGIYSSRGEFVLDAVREFSSDNILMFREMTERRKRSRSAEKELADVDAEIARAVNRIVTRTPTVPSGYENTTQIGIYIPQGLSEQIEFIMYSTPFIRNLTAYIRVAIQYKLEKMEEETLAAREYIQFLSSKNVANENIYLSSIEKNFDRMVRSGEEFICRDDIEE